MSIRVRWKSDSLVAHGRLPDLFGICSAASFVHMDHLLCDDAEVEMSLPAEKTLAGSLFEVVCRGDRSKREEQLK
jgi:hypothetical protein